MSIQEVSKSLNNAGIKHVVVSASNSPRLSSYQSGEDFAKGYVAFLATRTGESSVHYTTQAFLVESIIDVLKTPKKIKLLTRVGDAITAHIEALAPKDMFRYVTSKIDKSFLKINGKVQVEISAKSNTNNIEHIIRFDAVMDEDGVLDTQAVIKDLTTRYADTLKAAKQTPTINTKAVESAAEALWDALEKLAQVSNKSVSTLLYDISR